MKMIVLFLVVMMAGCAAGRNFSKGAAEAAKHPPAMTVCESEVSRESGRDDM